MSDLKRLELKCVELYDSQKGTELFEAMKKIRTIGFCVATSWSVDEVSIARSCYYQGRIFQFVGNYRYLIMPYQDIELIDELSYSNIEQFLPKQHSKQANCALDVNKKSLKAQFEYD